MATEAEVKEALAVMLSNGEITIDEAKQKLSAFRQTQTSADEQKFEVESNKIQAGWGQQYGISKRPDSYSAAIQDTVGPGHSGLLEAGKTIAGGLAGQVASGLAGIGATIPGGKTPAEAVESTQKFFAEKTAPKTDAGVQSLETIGDIINLGIDVVEIPVSGLAGIAELISGQGGDQAADTVKSIQENGFAETAGNRALEETANPILATAVYASPEIVASLVPVTKIGSSAAKARRAVKSDIAKNITKSQANPTAAKSASKISIAAKSDELTPDSISMLEDLRDAAPARLADEITSIVDDAKVGVSGEGLSSRIDDVASQFNQGSPDTRYIEYITKGSDNIKADADAIEAIKQGFGQDAIAMAKAVSPTDRKAMLEMTKIMEDGRSNMQFRRNNRPIDVVGRNLVERIDYIKNVNRTATNELDKIASGLKGKELDFSEPVDNFIKNLDDLDISLKQSNGGFEADFSDSRIRELPANQNAIKKVVNMMNTDKPIDGYEVHQLKKFIDDLVNYEGKAKTGLSGRTENVIKSLRYDLNALMRNQFPEYREVNKTLSDTISTLDDFQKSIGSKVDLDAPKLDKALGQELRKLETNYSSRIPLENALNKIDNTAIKYGGEFEGDLGSQVSWAYELDSVFRPAARGGFQGATAEATKKGIEMATGQQTGKGLLMDAAGKLMERARGINEENAFKSIKKVLER